MTVDMEQIIYRSPTPQDLYCYSPWLEDGFDGRILLSFDIAGPGLKSIPGPKSDHGDYGSNQCEIYVSDDGGHTWRHTARLPMLHARVFKAGKYLYILGHSGRLVISRSDDNGETWGDPSVLEAEHHWHQAPCAIDRRHGKIYISMEHRPFADRWAGGDPVLMSASESADLLKASSWTFSNKVEFVKTIPKTPNLFGIAPTCWLESNVVRIYDKDHQFHDPDDRTVFLISRVAGLKFKNYAAILQGKEAADGSLTLDTVKQADGTPLLLVPFPGGFMKFHIIYDEKSRLYWLIASQSSDSMAKPESIPREQLWFDERRRMELFYSKNLFDWCSAGLVAVGPCAMGSRHYASLLINGDDLLVLSRSGDEHTKDSHDTDLITLHRVKGFRGLAV